jgi:diguanylate cyclase (GGDEF)-like protein
MQLPTLRSIATDQIVTASQEASLSEAVEKMKTHDLRDLVVTGGTLLRLIDAQSIIRFHLEGIDFSTPLAKLDLAPITSIHEETGLLEALEGAGDASEYLCLVDSSTRPTGIVSYSDLITHIDPDRVVESLTLGELLPASPTCTITEALSTREALEKMRQNRSDSVLIADENDQLVGILTQKDAIKLFASQVDLTLPASSYMSHPLSSVSPNMRVWEAYAYLRENHFKRLVVCDEHRLCGIITQRELVSKSFARRMELIRQHEQKLRESGHLSDLKNIRTVGTIDALTGLFNRQMFNELFHREIARSRRYKEPLTLILIDIDHFKPINDTYGHLIGDQILIELSKELETILRTSDLLARWGGEEFALLLSHTDLAGAKRAGEKIREHLAASRFGGPGSITVSMGAAQYSEGDSEESLFQRADEALYAAKNAGRDRLCIA